ncbi:hypothetical protein M433DRAFT_7723 [Acidomyces richmondensis BFW]|nr:MAG: hypothetical protein FE78DRAFT_28239 [Acidomyces sp. 'richmondensis']KYG41717.1 hypothetical protein M433DRAFT_7723 [Acidomyces richmondensis BFW]
MQAWVHLFGLKRDDGGVSLHRSTHRQPPAPRWGERRRKEAREAPGNHGGACATPPPTAAPTTRGPVALPSPTMLTHSPTSVRHPAMATAMATAAATAMRHDSWSQDEQPARVRSTRSGATDRGTGRMQTTIEGHVAAMPRWRTPDVPSVVVGRVPGAKSGPETASPATHGPAWTRSSSLHLLSLPRSVAPRLVGICPLLCAAAAFQYARLSPAHLGAAEPRWVKGIAPGRRRVAVRQSMAAMHHAARPTLARSLRRSAESHTANDRIAWPPPSFSSTSPWDARSKRRRGEELAGG